MSAVISDCGRYRYELRRRCSLHAGRVCWIMLNPSTADAEVDDPTIRRCMRFTRDWGYGEMVVVNLFPLRATDPGELVEWLGGAAGSAELSQVAERNGSYVGTASGMADLTIAAWGAGRLAEEASPIIRQRDVPLHVLGLTKGGAPRHPLYVRANTQPQRWPLG